MSALSDLVQMLKQDKKTGSDYTGTVTRVEGDTVYVRITGSDIMDTPVKMSIDAKAGDTVRVRVANGKAWLTGNDTAPPTNDTKKIQKIQNDLYEPGGKVSSITKIVEKVGQLAANTNQYFWRTDKGTDTGIHITEVPRDTFLKDPENGGGNLLARSNGIAVRNGLTELAQFRGDGIDFYDQYGANVVDIDTNCASFSSRFTYSEQNNNVQSNVPWVLNVREKSPYFADFTSTWYLLHVEINGVVSEFVHPWTADFTETVTSSGKTTTIDYSYADGTITFTYVGNTNPIWIYAYPQWSSSIVSSAFTFGTRSGTKGAFSGTIGVGLKAEYETQIVFGRYNSNNSANMLEVGGGEADGARINLLELKKTSGNLKIKGSLTQGSDRRLKTHKSYLDDDAIQFIRKLKPAYYIKDGEDHVGFYAQDVAEADPWHSMTGESDGYMTLCYTEIIAPLVKYCQSLEKRIAELEGK